MACRYTYQGTTYEAHEFDDVLRAMSPSVASQFMPSVKAVPNAPFVGKTGAWVDLALKRVVKLAVDEGFDRVAFVTGQQSADRYDLSKQVKRIEAWKKGDGYSVEVFPNGHNSFTRENQSAAQLEELVGKDMAKRIVSDVDAWPDRTGRIQFTGLDLKVGGEGMAAFYDKIIPAAVNKLLDKLDKGAKIGAVPGPGPSDLSVEAYKGRFVVSRGEEVLKGPFNSRGEALNAMRAMENKGGIMPEGQIGFDITDKMREAAGPGLPLFNQGERGMRTVQVDGVRHPDSNSKGQVLHPTFQGQVNFWRWFSPGPRAQLADISEARVDRLKRDVQTLADFLEGHPLSAKGNGGIDVPVPVLRAMAGVAGVHPEVARAIVRALPVPVVDFLGRQKGAPEDALHDESVLKNLLSPEGNTAVALGVDVAAIERAMRVVAKAGAEITGLTGRALEANAATLARKLDSVSGAHADIMTGFGGSKVADGQGRPLVVYHGTDQDVARFDGERDPKNYASDKGKFFFTTDPHAASGYAEDPGTGKPAKSPNVMPVYVSLQNPYVIDNSDDPAADWDSGGDTYASYAEDGGHDGIIIQTEDGSEKLVIAFRPEQIKSATGNNGQFSPDDGNILFAQANGGDTTVANPRDYWNIAREAVAELGNTPGKLHWWHKTVGTQFNLAKRYPAFKKVFDRVQEFLNDVSLYATESADLAPNILPKLETWRDMGKVPISAKDAKAIAAPIFEGTLMYGRDPEGNAARVDTMERAAARMSPEQQAEVLERSGSMDPAVLRMWRGLPREQYQQAIATAYKDRILSAGIVWSDDELATLYGLDARQRGLYREARAAIDQSIHHLAISDILRYVGDDAAGLRADLMDMGDVGAAAQILRQHLMEMAEADHERAQLLRNTAGKVTEKAERARKLIKEGYAPLSRFGQYYVDIVSAGGERLFFGLAESRFEAARLAKRLQDAMSAEHPGLVVTRGTLSQEDYKLFAGVSPETLELFGEMLGLELEGASAKDKAFQEYIKLARNSRSSMKRLIHRKGIAGFSEDVGRVLAGFVYSNARQTSRNLHMGEIDQMAAAIGKGDSRGEGELKDAAVRLATYIKNPVEEAQALRGLLFAQYLGGNIASALVNMSQPFQITTPYLSQWGGITKAAGRMKDALKVAWADTTGDAALDAALERAVKEGIVAPQEVHQLIAQSAGRGALKSGDGTAMGDAAAAVNNGLARLQLGWGKFFSTAELFNRRVTFVAAYNTAVQQDLGDPYAFAVEAVDETQFIYNKGNKPQWARGAVGSTVFTFKQYSIGYLELMSRMWNAGEPGSPEQAAGRRAVMFSMGMLLLMGGAGGLPFVSDVEDVVDGVAQRLGYNWSTKQKRQELFDEAFGRGMGHVLEKGVSGLPGVPVDVAGRFSMGNMVPGTGLLVKGKSHGRDVAEVAGPVSDLAARALEAIELAAGGDPVKGGLRASPMAIQNLSKSMDMASSGIYKDQRGYKVLDVDGYDAVAKAIGFQPNAVARVQEADRTAQAMVARTRSAESQIADRWAKAIAESDQQGIADARQELADWNARNPDTPIRIRLQDVLRRANKMRQPRAERIEKSAPKEVRAEAGRILRGSE